MSDACTGSSAWQIDPASYLASRAVTHQLPAKPRSRYLTMPDGWSLLQCLDQSFLSMSQNADRYLLIGPWDHGARVRIRVLALPPARPLADWFRRRQRITAAVTNSLTEFRICAV